MHTCRVEYPAPRAPAPLGRFALPSSPSRSTMISGLRKRRNRLCATECAREARRTFRCSMAKAIRKLLRLMRGPEINKEVSPVNRRDHKDRGEPADLSVSAAGKDTQAPNTRPGSGDAIGRVFWVFCLYFVCLCSKNQTNQIKSNQIKSNQIKSNQIK